MHFRAGSGSVTSATSLLPVLEVSEEDNHTTGISAATSGLHAESRRPPMAPCHLQFRSNLKEPTSNDFLISSDGGSEYVASSRRRHMSNTLSLAHMETLGEGGAEGGSRRRSVNAAKDYLLPHDM